MLIIPKSVCGPLLPVLTSDFDFSDAHLVFAVEAFLMAGGWLFFDNAQELYVGVSVWPKQGSEATRGPDAKLVLRTLKNPIGEKGA